MYRAHLISSLLLVASLVSPVAPIAVRRGGGYYRRRSASAATAAARGSFDTGLPAARGDSFLKPHSSSSEARRWSGSLQPADASILRKLWSNMWGRAAAHSVRTTAGADSVRARMGDANASAAAARLAYDPDDPDPMVAEEEDAAESLTATVPLTTLRAIVAAGARRSTGAARRRETAAEARRRSRRTSRRGAERPFTVGAAQVPPPRLPSELSIRMLYAGIISAVLILLSGAALAARAARWYCDARCLDSQHRRPLRPAVRACGAELGVAGLLGLIGYVFVRSGAFDLLAVRLLGEQPGTQVVALFYHVHELVVISAAVYVALIVFVISSARVLMRKWRSFEVSRHADVLHYFDEELRADARDGFLAPCCRPCRRGGVARGKERMAFMALREATLQLIVSPTEQLGRRSERAYGFDFAQYLGHSLGAVVGSVALVTVWMWCLVEVLLTLVLCLPGPDAVASGWVPLVVVAWGYVLLAALVALDAALHRTFWSTTMRAVHSYKAVEDAWMEEGGREDARASMRRRRGGGKGGKEKDDDGLSERGNRRFRKMYEEWRRADADGMYEPEADGASTRRCCGVSVGRTQARVARMMREVVVVLRTVLLLGATYVAALGLVASLLLRRRGRRAGWTAAIAIAAGLVPIFATLARLPPMLEKLILISKTSRVGLDRTVISEVSREQRARSAVGALRVYDWLFSLVTAEHAKPVSWNDLLDTMMANSRQAPMLIDDATGASSSLYTFYSFFTPPSVAHALSLSLPSLQRRRCVVSLRGSMSDTATGEERSSKAMCGATCRIFSKTSRSRAQALMWALAKRSHRAHRRVHSRSAISVPHTSRGQ